MLLYPKLKHMVTLVENSLLKLLTYFTIFLTYLYVFLFSFTTLLNVKQTNTFLLNLITSPLHYFFMKTQLTLFTDFPWTLKDLSPLRLKVILAFFFIIDAFSHFVVINRAPQISPKYAIQTLLHHWITKLGPPQRLVTDRGTECINLDMTHLCSLFNVNHSPRTPNSPWTNGLVEVQNRNLGTHLRLFLKNLPDYWSFQTQMYAYAHNTAPLSQFKLSPHQIVYQIIPRIPLTFSLNLPRDSSKSCIAKYCNSLPPHTHYGDHYPNPFFHSLIVKPISPWLLSAEHAILENFSFVNRHITNKLNPRNSTFETPLLTPFLYTLISNLLYFS